MKYITSLLLCMFVGISSAASQQSPIANVKFEIRLADEKPGPGLIEVSVEDSEEKIYLYDSTVLSSTEVVSANVVKGDFGLQIMVEFSEEGGDKMFAATSNNMGKRLAVVAGGKVVFAPKIQAAVSNSAAISGNFTTAEAERLAGLIRNSGSGDKDLSPVAGKNFEMRLAWEKPGPELIEVSVGDEQDKLYLDKVLLNQSHVKSAEAEIRNGSAVINVAFQKSGVKLLNEATAVGAKSGAYLAVIVDGRVIFAPKILEAISSPAMITGDFSIQEARRLAAVIQWPRPAASLLLIKTDWSLAKNPDQVSKDVRLLLQNEDANAEELAQLPASAGKLVLFNDFALTYTPREFGSILAWLTEQELITKRIPLMDFRLRSSSASGRRTFFSTSGFPPAVVGLPPLPELISKSLYSEISPEFRLSIGLECRQSDVQWLITGALKTVETFRGHSPGGQIAELEHGNTEFGCNSSSVSVVNVMPKNTLLRSAIQRTGHELLLVLESEPSMSIGRPSARLQLPQSVERPKTNSSGSTKLAVLLSSSANDPASGNQSLDPSVKSGVELLSFTASYCQPCQQMLPILKTLQRDKFPVKIVDITSEPHVTQQYHIDRIPTHVLLVDGKESARTVGVVEESELRNMMNRVVKQVEIGASETTSEVVMTNTEEDVDRLRTEFEAQKNRLNQLVAASGNDGLDSSKDLQRIKQAVSDLFDAKQELRHAELAQMSKRIRDSRAALAARAKSKEKAVAKRVDELIGKLRSNATQNSQ